MARLEYVQVLVLAASAMPEVAPVALSAKAETCQALIATLVLVVLALVAAAAVQPGRGSSAPLRKPRELSALWLPVRPNPSATLSSSAVAPSAFLRSLLLCPRPRLSLFVRQSHGQPLFAPEFVCQLEVFSAEL